MLGFLESLARQGKREVLEGQGAARGPNLKGIGLMVRHKSNRVRIGHLEAQSQE